MVLAHLGDPQSYVGLTPFVVRVEDVVVAQHAVRYTAVERFRFLGLLRWDNPIRVVMRVDPVQRRITQEVTSPGGVRLRSTVDLLESAEGATVDELIEVSSPRLLRSYVLRQARRAQLYRAGELARRLTGDVTPRPE